MQIRLATRKSGRPLQKSRQSYATSVANLMDLRSKTTRDREPYNELSSTDVASLGEVLRSSFATH